MAAKGKDDGRSDKKQTKKRESLREIYARRRREFTVADLQEYTELDEGVPLEPIIAEMEEMNRRAEQKKKRK